ncbi:uncharacterized protein LOC111831154 [Capsella rubella]|uniref:uncharacterized protein LOC111831154 n=1 Tax=Capsella rubella TaxID=81985 RepID=UPI000CD550B5|nr:uncharacterized protein LOC111831154 [Capsella rubella]XP_023640617.1 uncharacterized protein LOC111831154 [Capsella rubella]XP_023640618.1 uncharacterized protein LOC111831154 [Capsella rubella]
MGKRPAEEDVDESMVDMEPRRVVAPRKTKNLPPPEELYAMFKRQKFVGTRYPHRQTMKELGIARDIEFLFQRSGLGSFMTKNLEAYDEETCYVLASLQLHFYEDETEFHADDCLGYITFSVKGTTYSLTFKEVENLYGFLQASGMSQDVLKEKIKSVWKTIGDGKEYTSSKSKSAQIRNPAVRYFHKSLASMIFARKETGNVNESEIQLIDIALSGVLPSTRDSRELVGDRTDGSMVLVLLDQLMYCNDWVLKAVRRGVQGKLSIGGLVTPLLVACDVELRGKGSGTSSKARLSRH